MKADGLGYAGCVNLRKGHINSEQCGANGGEGVVEIGEGFRGVRSCANEDIEGLPYAIRIV